MNTKRGLLAGMVLAAVFFLSGCALLQVPATVLQGTFSLMGRLVDLAGKLPKPPPGVFF